MSERTLVLIKPDALANHHAGDIIKRYEQEDLQICAMKLLKMTPAVAAIHYAEHVGRPYYQPLVEFMCSGPIIAMVLAGDDAIARVRKLHGATDPAKAEAGTIRKMYAESNRRNAVHASDSPAAAEREIHIYFSDAELCY
jgi:nucleoside-diphosphate kinase